MTGDCHVRFCESGRGRFPPATHQKRDRVVLVAEGGRSGSGQGVRVVGFMRRGRRS